MCCPICPVTHESLLGLGTAVVASFAFGFVWYGPLFGKKWADLMGFKMDEKCTGKPPVSSLLLTLFGTLLTTIAMAYIINIYKPDCNFGAAFLVWLGFYIPLLLGTVTWERRPWNLFALNAIYYFLNLQLIATVLTFIR
jgi:hypothetical protein